MMRAAHPTATFALAALALALAGCGGGADTADLSVEQEEQVLSDAAEMLPPDEESGEADAADGSDE